MEYKGEIIEESLKDITILKELKIIKTNSETVTSKHRTPWLKKWTIHSVLISEEGIDGFCEKLSKALDDTHEWYIEIRNNRHEKLIFHDKVIDRKLPLFK